MSQIAIIFEVKDKHHAPVILPLDLIEQCMPDVFDKRQIKLVMFDLIDKLCTAITRRDINALVLNLGMATAAVYRRLWLKKLTRSGRMRVVNEIEFFITSGKTFNEAIHAALDGYKTGQTPRYYLVCCASILQHFATINRIDLYNLVKHLNQNADIEPILQWLNWQL